jgi:hypothetical protein
MTPARRLVTTLTELHQFLKGGNRREGKTKKMESREAENIKREKMGRKAGKKTVSWFSSVIPDVCP